MSKNNAKNLILLAIISFVLMTANIGGLYIYAIDEAKNAVCAREMMDRGDWIVPTFNDELRTDKPPLHYYFMRIAYQIFGVNAFAARFFSSIMGVLTILFTWWLGVKLISPRAGFYAALILISSLHFAIQFHMSVPDPYLIFLITAGLGSFFIFYKEGNTKYLLLSYISFGLGALAKGPIAIALPGLSILIFLIIKKDFGLKYIIKLKPLWILGVLILIILPWYLMVGIKTNGEWINDFFFTHNFGRYSNSMEGHGANFLATPLMVFIGLLPFSSFVYQGFRDSFKERNSNPFLLYILIIASTIIVFFSISQTKLPNYTVPAYPFIALIIGFFLANTQERFGEFRKGVIISNLVYLVFMVSLPIGLYYGISLDPALSNLSLLSAYFIILPVGALMALLFSFKNNFKGMVISISASWVITTLMFFFLIFPVIDRENPIAKSLPLVELEKPFASYRIFNPAYAFYLKRPIPEFDNKEDLNDFIKENVGGYVISRRNYEEEFNENPKLIKIFEGRDIFEPPTTVIYKISE